MQKSDIFSVVFLCIINIIFMVAGIFLNSVVIISLWKTSQLRKKDLVCYFMILVLSCFDLAVVTITHPCNLDRIYNLFFRRRDSYLQGHKELYIFGFTWFLVVCAFYAECWTIPSTNVSIFPSSISHKNKASMFSGIFDGYNSRYIPCIATFQC
jgi:hypothetical protein